MQKKLTYIYIKVNGDYKRISYSEYQQLAHCTDYVNNHWFIPVQNTLLEVPHDIYQDFYKDLEHSKYLRRTEQRYTIVSIENQEYSSCLLNMQNSLEEQVEENEQIEKIRYYYPLLSETDKKILDQCIIQNQHKTAVAHNCGITVSQLNYRLKKLLQLLKKILNE